MHKLKQAFRPKRNVKIKNGTMYYIEFCILMFQMIGKERVLSRMALELHTVHVSLDGFSKISGFLECEISRQCFNHHW